MRTPYRAVLALGAWGYDHWPYVSGRALLSSGTKLSELDMADFLDVIHALFEDSSLANTEEEAKNRERLRSNIYTSLYGYKSYAWVSADSGSRSADSSFGQDMMPVDATGEAAESKLTHKPYVPPTPMDVNSPLPIAGIKEAPLG